MYRINLSQTRTCTHTHARIHLANSYSISISHGPGKEVDGLFDLVVLFVLASKVEAGRTVASLVRHL